jgi:hypothetical protein
MADPAFSVEHRQTFRELRAIGELHAINLSLEQLDFGPWSLGCDIDNHDTADRLKGRFRAAVRKAAVAAGAPPRANLLDWWICRLARENRPYLQGLIQRSIELCEEFEAASIEDGWNSRKPGAMGLRRDRYPTDFIVPYWLYDVPHDTLPDPEGEFEYWKDHVWQGFSKLLQDLEKNGLLRSDGSVDDARKRQPGETRLAFRNRVANRVSMGYYRIKPTFECLGFDLAVLLANYVIDRRLGGSEAMRAFDTESAQLVEKMKACWKESSCRLGLSWRKQLKQGKDSIDLGKPFRVVEDDLKLLVAAPQDPKGATAPSQPGAKAPTNPESVAAVSEPPRQEVDSATIAQETRALTVARLIRELDALKPQMFEDKAEYEKLRAQHPKFLAFEIAEARPDLKLKILAIRGSIRHVRLAQELAAAHHGRQLSTIQEDWKNFKPSEYRRPK